MTTDNKQRQDKKWPVPPMASYLMGHYHPHTNNKFWSSACFFFISSRFLLYTQSHHTQLLRLFFSLLIANVIPNLDCSTLTIVSLRLWHLSKMMCTFLTQGYFFLLSTSYLKEETCLSWLNSFYQVIHLNVCKISQMSYRNGSPSHNKILLYNGYKIFIPKRNF